jgi:circadian clock protein KaiA
LSGRLTIAILADSAELLPLLSQFLSADFYALEFFTDRAEFLAAIETGKNHVDCLIFCSERHLLPVINILYERGIVLPVAIFHRVLADRIASEEPDNSPDLKFSNSYIYQPSEVILPISELSEVGVAIDKAIAKFLNLTPIMPASKSDGSHSELERNTNPRADFVVEQQSRLSQKLDERLGYLAIYYKRSPSQFFRHLDRQQKQKLIDDLKLQYRAIILQYFGDTSNLNDKIDEFVSAAFFRDLAVSEIVKIHMELMEEFSDQLKLEGRSEEILLDYRLTLIDIIAHLCEMYRRSIPREM